MPFEVINIGNVEIKKTAALAPMASVADRAYRLICKEYGASYMVSEMISSKGICYSDKKTEELCTVLDEERPMALQLFGEDPVFMNKAAGILMKYKPDIIDINMGCPVPKIVNNNSGSALMKDPELAYNIVKETVKGCDVPVTVKIRSGFDDNNINAPEFARAMESAGASAITIHSRTRKQMYSGKASLDIIKKVKESVNVPVIGNGDIMSGEDAEKMYEYTGCDLVMVGRGSYGKPYIFKEIECFLSGEKYTSPAYEERLDMLYKEVCFAVKFKGEKTAVQESRRICGMYLRGIPNAAKYRAMCSELMTLEDVKTLIERVKENLA